LNRRKLQDKTVDELAESFVKLVLSSAKTPGVEAANLGSDIREIEDELKARGTEHHRDLLPLASHTDERVRFEAVAATYRMMLGNSQVTAKLVQQLAVAIGAPFLKRSSSALTVARMSRSKLRSLTNEELVRRFVDIGLAQDEALVYGEIAKFNRLFGQKDDVVEELRKRPGDQRRALLNLYDHPNLQVRLNAVKNSLALAPDDGRRVLQAIADSGEYPQAGDAGMCPSNLDEGVFKPT
jgi:hypothetical protein